ncbi:MAG: TetR/AcrR family transcriptional regulator [Actinomycetota bacterium]
MAMRLPAPERREQLLSVALTVFARHGYHDTSMNEVAEAAGITKPVLYQHFASKRELFLDVIEEAGRRMISAITTQATTDTDGRRRTELGFRAYFTWVAEDHDAFMLLFGSGSRRDAEFADAVRQFSAKVADAIEPLITADIDASHRRTLAYAIVGMTEAISRRLVEDGAKFDPDFVARQVSDLAWAGLRAVQRPR